MTLPTSFDPLWDERARGPRMSNVVGRTIHKYQIPVQEQFVMRLPKGAEIIRIADQGGMLWLWAVIDTEAEFEERKFHAFKTGAAIPTDLNLTYVGFGAIYIQAELALYIFEELPTLQRTPNEGETPVSERYTKDSAIKIMGQALNDINKIICGTGAPLASEEYFAIRTECCDALRFCGIPIT